MPRSSCILLSALFLGTLAGGPRPLGAQCLPSTIPPEEAAPCREHYPRWAGELASFGANAILGAFSGGIMQELKGGSFRRGFTRGFAGGGIIYVGKRVSVERFDGAGLVGRQVAAVGSSVVRNAGDGVGLLERLYLPLGVARLEVYTYAGHVRFIPDLTALGWTLWAVSRSELTLDRSASLSAGTPVFRTDNKILQAHGDTAHASGVTNSGVIYIVGIPALGPVVARKQLAHERVHVLQEDQLFLTVTDPLEELVLRQLPYVGRYATRVDVNLASELLRGMVRWFPKHLERPWETEAIFFSR